MTIFLVPNIYNQNSLPFLPWPSVELYLQRNHLIDWYAGQWHGGLWCASPGLDAQPEMGGISVVIYTELPSILTGPKRRFVLIKRSCILIVARKCWKVKLCFQGIWVESMKHDLSHKMARVWQNQKLEVFNMFGWRPILGNLGQSWKVPSSDINILKLGASQLAYVARWIIESRYYASC